MCPSGAEERIEGESPAKIVEGLAALKARDIFDKSLGSMTEDFTVIGADTVVAYQGEILGKPTDQEEALAMLSMLANRTHQVYTGVCLIQMKGEKKYTRTFHVCTQVTFYPVSREDRRSHGQGRLLRDTGAFCRSYKGDTGRLQQCGGTSHCKAVP